MLTTVHKDVTQRLIWKRRLPPSCMVQSSCLFNQVKPSRFQKRKNFKVLKVVSLDGKLLQVAKILFQNDDNSNFIL